MHSWGPSRPETEPTPRPVWEGVPDLACVRCREMTAVRATDLHRSVLFYRESFVRTQFRCGRGYLLFQRRGVLKRRRASQTFTVLSWLPLTIRFPSGLKLTLMTKYKCPVSVSVSWPVWAPQTFSVLPLVPPILIPAISTCVFRLMRRCSIPL